MPFFLINFSFFLFEERKNRISLNDFEKRMTGLGKSDFKKKKLLR